MRTSLKTAALALISILILISLAACSGQPATTPSSSGSPSAQPSGRPNSQSSRGPQSSSSAFALPTNILPANQAKAVRGQGTVAAVKYVNLYFGSAGQIAAINVLVGDQVKKGAVLSKLDTTSLEAALSQAQVNLDQAKLTQTQSQSALVTAQYNLDKTKTVSDLKDLINDDQIAISTAQANLNLGQANGDNGTNSLVQNIASYQKDLKNLQDRLSRLLSQDPYTSTDQSVYINGQKYDRLTVEDIQNKQLAVNSAQQSVDKSQDAITQAQKNLDWAKQQLDQATITAPFDGVIAAVNQNAGDVVSAPASSQRPIIYMIDPTNLELDIQINELDMPQVKVGKTASITINAFPDAKLNGQVKAFSPIPAVQGGLVSYLVKITFSIPADITVQIGMNGSAAIPVS